MHKQNFLELSVEYIYHICSNKTEFVITCGWFFCFFFWVLVQARSNSVLSIQDTLRGSSQYSVPLLVFVNILFVIIYVLRDVQCCAVCIMVAVIYGL